MRRLSYLISGSEISQSLIETMTLQVTEVAFVGDGSWRPALQGVNSNPNINISYIAFQSVKCERVSLTMCETECC
jgi:hypothetical protein